MYFAPFAAEPHHASLKSVPFKWGLRFFNCISPWSQLYFFELIACIYLYFASSAPRHRAAEPSRASLAFVVEPRPENLLPPRSNQDLYS